MSEDDDSPLQRFEDLASRMFRTTKEDLEKAKRKAEEIAAEIVEKPEEPSPEDC